LLTTTFLALAVLGCGYIVLAGFLGHLTDVGGDSHGHHDGAGADFHFPLFSPLALATLFSALGGYGLIAKYAFELDDWRSIAVAFPSALVTAWGVAYAAFRIMRGARGTSSLKTAAFEGASAEVLTSIPAGGIGEVAAIVEGQRITGPARHEAGTPIAQGAAVTVVRMVGSTFLVRLP
jgi:membrane-bound ClpP family serine protease